MNIHGGYHGEEANMLDFSININPLGMPPRIKNVLIESIDKLIEYPEISGKTAAEKLAADLGLAAEQLILGNGAIDLIYLYARTFRQHKAMIVGPTFNEYARAMSLYGVAECYEFTLLPQNDFQLDVSDFLATVKVQAPEVIFLCNPNNPTGKLLPVEVINELIMATDSEILWFIDESFLDFTDGDSCRSLVEKRPGIFVLNSLTKLFALPGLRLGYGYADQKTIKIMEQMKEPWAMNALALTAAAHVYEEKGFIAETKDLIRSESARVYKALNAIEGIKAYSSAADFHLVEICQMTGKALNQELNQYHINVRTCVDFTGLEERFVRIAVKKKSDNDALIAAITKIMEG